MKAFQTQSLASLDEYKFVDLPMPELLLELFSEEIPARMQARAEVDLQRLRGQHLILIFILACLEKEDTR